MRLTPLLGIHFCTANLTGKQINPKRMSAAMGRKTIAKIQVIQLLAGDARE